MDKDGVLDMTADKARNTLISIACSIVELDVQTREVIKAYNDLLAYYGKLLDTDFSAFKLQAKKAQKS